MENKCISDIQRLRMFISYTSSLRNLLKDVFQENKGGKKGELQAKKWGIHAPAKKKQSLDENSRSSKEQSAQIKHREDTQEK